MKVLMILTANYVNGQKKLPSWAIAQYKSLIKNIEELTIEQFHLVSRKSVKGIIQAGRALKKTSLKEKCNLVHAQWGTSTGLLTVLFSPLPVVVSFCGSDLLGNYDEKGKAKLSGKLSSILSQLAALGASRCIAKSSRLKKRLWPVSRAKCTVIPNGVDVDSFKPMDQQYCRKQLGWDHRRKYILFFHDDSRHGAWVKNPALAEATIKEANSLEPHFELFKVKHYPQEFLPVLYNAADALLITSFHEGSNNSVKEAMACNLPIVTVPCGDVEERLQFTEPSFIGNYHASELAKGLVQITNNQKRSNGREEVLRQGIDSKQVARKIFEVYHEALQ